KIDIGHRFIGFIAVRVRTAVGHTTALTTVKNWMQKLKPDFKSKRFWYRLVMVMLGGLVVGVVAILILFVWFSSDLPSPTGVVRKVGFSTQIFDRNGTLIYDLYKDAKRLPVTEADLPEYLKNATVAVEDKDFYKHKGFDPLTPLRIVKNFFVMGQLTGGSTLTQQLVKNVLLNSDKTVTRKLKEFILAVQIEARYKKSDILLMYLNEAPYGGAAWGVGSASGQYFNKSVKDLDLAESVILAGLPQRPSVYSPFSKTPTAYVDRSKHVLDRMVADGYINQELADKTFEEVKNYKFYNNQTTMLAPHFIFWVKDILAQKYGEELVDSGGLKVTTTLDLNLQTQVQQIVSVGISQVEKQGISNGAALVMDPVTGQVLAMVGSRGYNSDKTDGKFNVVTQGLRQPGSSIKPVTYVTALRKGYTAASMVMDVPVTFPGVGAQKDYSPQNYTGKFNGPMSLRNALGNSINTVAVKMLARVGIKNMMQQAFDMGISTLEPTTDNLKKFGLALTLGGGDVKMIDLTSAYCAFANGGTRVDPVGVLKVEDRTGKVLEQYQQVTGPQVMTPQEAFIISNILQDNNARTLTFGAVNGLIIPNHQVAVKTGTTNDKRDNWTVGWTPNLIVSTWVGNNDNSPMLKVASGVSGASPIWKQIMLAELPKINKVDFPIPDKIVNLSVDSVSGYAAHDNFSQKTEYFIDGTQPQIPDPIHLQLKVCRGASGLAPPEDVGNGNYDTKEYFKFQEDDPVSTDGVNRWQQGIDGWISQQPDKDKYNPPSGFCRTGGLLSVGFDSPGDHATVGNNFDIKISIDNLKKITEMKLTIDGVDKKTWTDRPFEMNINISDGPHTLHVKATDKDGNTAEREIKIGVNVPWDWSPSPTPTMTPVPTPTLIPTLIPSVTSVIPSGT
ncbi:MAG: PBP1A family penicillin-binding protein, partial [Candidatus Shapirobacteria bacterium]|nr:PBP1A family penicillin-binding protein [Candidatus Shapirobacteria bacterium]